MTQLTSTEAAAIKGSIVNPDAAQKLIDSLETPLSQAATIAAISTADASDLASAIALANATKAKVNALIAALKAAGLMA